jgi:dephospho-CoA kinase
LLRIGITGGLGSGKSTVCRIFSHLGVPVYEADAAAKRLMREDSDLIQGVKATFGADSYTGSEPNRPFLAAAVFGNPERLLALNALVHPAVFKDFENWCRAQTSAYVIKEAAIMFESGSHRQLHRVVVVAAPLETRILRAMQRDGAERKAIEQRLAHQLPQETLLGKADYIIHNDGTQSLIEQVLPLHRAFTELAKHPPALLNT